MKNLIQCIIAGGFLLASAGVLAQTTPTQTTQKEAAATKVTDRGSEGAITMEEYQILSEQFQKANPGKTFQNLSKEAFETYLTTELARLREKKAREAAGKQSLQKTESK